MVSRTANKDNSSFYQLNGRKVQFKEVGTLLKKHGIDLDHNRFLILQVSCLIYKSKVKILINKFITSISMFR